MILTLIQNAHLDTAVISQAEGGEVCFRDESGQTLLRTSGRGGTWQIVPEGACRLLAPSSAPLTPGQILPLQLHERSALLMVHSRLQHGKFTHLAIPDMMDVTIGSARDNAIVYTVAQVSAHHACLRYTHGAWQLQAVTGAVYVNGKRTRERPLSAGDAVTVMGLTLIPFPADWP
ncbi:MAG: FHA domain-containing protein [Eubacteriales bacterium]|nr:FHA domain-containing protein [Eubacteriales bacterium]